MCQNTTLNALLPGTVFRSHRICQRHFAKEDISRNNRLFKTAFPKLFMPGNVAEPVSSIFSHQLPEHIESEHTGEAEQNQVSISEGVQQLEGEYVSGSQHTASATAGIREPSQEPSITIRKRIRRAGLLASISATRGEHLTPRKKLLYREVRLVKKRLYNIQNKKLKCSRRLCYAKAAARTSLFQEMECQMNPIVRTFFKNQLRNKAKKPKGRRFTLDDKVMSLALLKESGKAYKSLS